MTSSHCLRDASWPSMPVRIRCIVEYTFRRGARTAKEAGSSRSCTARYGSTLWINPRVAVLTGVDTPTAPPPARGGGDEEYILLLAVDTGRWRSDLIVFSSSVSSRSVPEVELTREELSAGMPVMPYSEAIQALPDSPL